MAPHISHAPSYLALYESGELARRADAAWELLKGCTVCPQNCPRDRTRGLTGACHAGTEVIVGSWNLHYREEPPISGTRGAGTIFFGGCQARCTYCQNFWLSQMGHGIRVGYERLAEMMLALFRTEGAEESGGGVSIAAMPKDEAMRLIKELESQMRRAAKELEFEKAASLRDQIVELRRAALD